MRKINFSRKESALFIVEKRDNTVRTTPRLKFKLKLRSRIKMCGSVNQDTISKFCRRGQIYDIFIYR